MARQMDAEIVGCSATWEDLALAALKVTDATLREALSVGRDAVMESFDSALDKDDHLMAEMRVRSIDAALAMLPQSIG